MRVSASSQFKYKVSWFVDEAVQTNEVVDDYLLNLL